jgi:two-component system sensor histidine kinase ArlS
MLERLKFRKISWKLTLIYAFIFSAVLVALNAGTLFGVRFFLIQQAKNQVQNSSRITLNSITSPGEKINLSDPELLSESNSNSELNIRISDSSGKAINSSGRFGVENILPTSYIGKLKVLELKDEHLVMKNDLIIVQGETVGYLQVAYNMQKEYDFVKLLLILIAFADFIGIVISILAGFIISRRILKPIDQMTKSAKKISITDLKSRIDVGHTDDELSRLAITFNEMIERLQQSFEKQSRFVSDASHELRTPIAIIQGYAGLIDRWGKNDLNVLEESIAAICNETESMTSLIERLLFLARGDNNSLKLQKENIDIGNIIEEVIEESRLIAPNHHLDCKMDGKLELYADRKLIKQMLRALIDNSIKYTLDGGSINISASVRQKDIIIVVSDTGIGIPNNELSQIFDRFYMVDKARSKEKGGSGLGLSIVKWIVEAHQGTINIESTQHKGTSIFIHVPVNK